MYFRRPKKRIMDMKTKETSSTKKNGTSSVGRLTPKTKSPRLSVGLRKEEILRDYQLAQESRAASVLGRKEVLTGKAKFGIFGDGKELPQLAMARAFKKGDWRSGYYRDQTLMMALGLLSVQEFYAQLYAHTDIQAEPSSAGRSMNGHFGTRTLDSKGDFVDLASSFNSSADVSPTASQMPRLVGLAHASNVFKSVPELAHLTTLSSKGAEIAWGTIGNASCAEGMFWESVNAIGVLKAPAIISIWDDGYGISVPNSMQVTKDNIGTLLSGFQRSKGDETGFDIYTVTGWDYSALIKTYMDCAEKVRAEGFPAIIHVVEVSQPQGHSTSGSHERYKSTERLQWEVDFDCLKKFREWILGEKIATEEDLLTIESNAVAFVQESKSKAWSAFQAPIMEEIENAAKLIEDVAEQSTRATELLSVSADLRSIREPFRADIFKALGKTLVISGNESTPSVKALKLWKNKEHVKNEERYSSFLHSEKGESALEVPVVSASYSVESPKLNGSEILNNCFDKAFARDPRLIAFGEDLGQLGDVNQGFIGLQAKYGAVRISDTGIRETTILGQAIGLAMRGLRPICELQYLDYVLYALQLMSDDLATLQWRTKGGQKAPVIVRTRGHRLEGIWHSGSPMAGIINLVRGIHVCVPRNMTQAAGMYNTLFLSDEPALVVEVLNGYRLKETLPDNIGEFTVPLGIPEVLLSGEDVTIVTYGPLCRIALESAKSLESLGVSVEIIDVQTLLPFDTHSTIVESLKKTSRVLFLDEDVPGGCSAYMMQEVLERQNGYQFLDSAPKTLTAKPHRPAYGTDGNYWSKPETEHIIETVYEMVRESNPTKFPDIFN